MKKNYVIEPQNEPLGEGNGWHKCAEEAATGFAVYLNDELVEFFPTRRRADVWVLMQTHKKTLDYLKDH